MRWKIIITLTLFLVSCSSDYDTLREKILFNKVSAALKNHDAKDLSDSDYDNIAAFIAQGKTRWIRLYPMLNKAPFLGATFFQEGLHIVMAYALPRNPNEVLKFVDDKNIDDICGAPFIEPTHNEMRDYFAETRTALNNASSAGRWKAPCLMRLRTAIADKSSLVR